MYTDDDLTKAVEAGCLDADAAQRFQTFVAQSRSQPIADEERFRLVASFNDIFVLLASAMLLGAAFILLGNPLSFFVCAALAWVLAEVFTRSRRMATPSIFYAAIWAIYPAFGIFMLVEDRSTYFRSDSQIGLVAAFASALVTVLAALFWKRFRVPISIALGTGGLVGICVALLFSAGVNVKDSLAPFFLIAGLAVFAYAMRFDMKDLQRTTLNADIAFWLHLLAASLAVHSIFALLGQATPEQGSASYTLLALLAFFVLMMVALIIDRRAILVSAAIYVIVALVAGLKQSQDFQHSGAVVAAVVGAFLLLLSWGWSPLRRFVLKFIPQSIAARLPQSH